MLSMYTQCSSCSTWFRITPEQLRAAEGMAKCSQCGTLFNAVEGLSTQPPADELAKQQGRSGDQTAPKQTLKKARTSDDAAATQLTGSPRIVIDDEYIDAEPPHKHKQWHDLGWALLSAAAVFGLVVQFFYWTHDRHTPGSTMYSVSNMVCRHLGCDMDNPKNVKEIKLIKLTHTYHPQHQDGLFINGFVLNEAEFAQEFPTLRILLRDENENDIGARDFYPHEYIADKDNVDVDSKLPVGQPVRFVLELVDPGKKAVGINFIMH